MKRRRVWRETWRHVLSVETIDRGGHAHNPRGR